MSRNDQTAREFLGMLHRALGCNRAFTARSILEACDDHDALCVFIHRAGLTSTLALGQYLRACEGLSCDGFTLWRERESRRSHVYSLRSA